MRGTATLSRPMGNLGKTLSAPSRSHICRTCLAQAQQPLQQQQQQQQRRQIQSSAPRTGFLDFLTGRSGRKVVEEAAAEKKTAVVTSSSSSSSEVVNEGKDTTVASVTREGRVVARSPRDDPGYTPATTWAGLERVGSPAWVEKRLDRGGKYKGWAIVKKDVELEKKDAEEIVKKAASEIIADAKGLSWLDVSIREPEQKFRIAKRLQQQGIRLSDFALNTSGTLRELSRQMTVKPKPTKVAPVVEEVIVGLPNVTLHASRVTPIDKEKAVGRWKVIEQALIDQGLPVTGYRVRGVARS